MRPLVATWLGRWRYAPAFALQRELAARRGAGDLPDTLLLLEHEPVYTLGRRAARSEILLDEQALAARGVEVEESDRGGRVTYHGPGQLVGYPILDLGPAGDLVGYVRSLETAMITLLAEFGVTSGTVEGLTGVWAGDAKIAAIGVHVARGITTHGFALNVSTDLDAFNGIIPCGIVDRGVTSIEALTGRAPSVHQTAARIAEHLARVLDRDLRFAAPHELGIEEFQNV